MTNTAILEIALEDAKQICAEHDIPFEENVTIKANSRYTARWGNCRKVSPFEYEISISTRLLEDGVSYEALMNTVIHELLHTCYGCMNHGKLWKQYASRVNEDGYNIQTCTSCAEKAIKELPVTYRYAVTCNNCGHIWHYQKRGAVVRALQRDSRSCTCSCGSRELMLKCL